MIIAEEKIRERFSDRNNRDNQDRQNRQSNRHEERKRGPDNTIATTDKSKKIFKPRKYEDIENVRCVWHPKANHSTRECYFFVDHYTRKDKKEDKKEDNHKKDEDSNEGKGFQKSKETVAVIFAGVPGSRSKNQDKLALRTIMAAEPATPRYLNWS